MATARDFVSGFATFGNQVHELRTPKKGSSRLRKIESFVDSARTDDDEVTVVHRSESVSLDPIFIEALSVIAHALAEGTQVAVITRGREISSQKVADILNVSRPWQDEILVETQRNAAKVLVKQGVSPDEAAARTLRTITVMREAFGDALLDPTLWLPRISKMSNDPKDRHVLAAAVDAKATRLVTENTKDFPVSSRQGVLVQRPCQTPSCSICSLLSPQRPWPEWRPWRRDTRSRRTRRPSWRRRSARGRAPRGSALPSSRCSKTVLGPRSLLVAHLRAVSYGDLLCIRACTNNRPGPLTGDRAGLVQLTLTSHLDGDR